MSTFCVYKLSVRALLDGIPSRPLTVALALCILLQSPHRLETLPTEAFGAPAGASGAPGC